MSTLNIDVSVDIDQQENDGYPSEVVISIDEDRRIYTEKNAGAYEDGYADGFNRGQEAIMHKIAGIIDECTEGDSIMSLEAITLVRMMVMGFWKERES